MPMPTQVDEGEAMTQERAEDEDWDAVILDEDFVSGAPTEASAEERIAQARRIARANDRLRAEGEISDGTGKPAYRRLRRSAPWIVIGAIVGGVIVVVALLAR
jgi:hypothetical protein